MLYGGSVHCASPITRAHPCLTARDSWLWMPPQAYLRLTVGRMGRRLFKKFVRAGRDGCPWRAAGMDFWNKQHGFLTRIVAKVHQSGPWGRAVDGQPWRAAGTDFWNKRHGFLAPIFSKVCQIGPWERTVGGPYIHVNQVRQSGPWEPAVTVDGRSWRATGTDFWNKRYRFLAPIVAEVRQSGPWEPAVDGRPWRAAGMDFWNKRHGFLAPIVSKVCQIGPWERTVAAPKVTMVISQRPIEIQWVSRK